MREFGVEDKPKLRLVSFGDPVLDTLYARSQEKPERAKKITETFPEPGLCHSCGETRILLQKHASVMCRGCHEWVRDYIRRHPAGTIYKVPEWVTKLT